MKTVLDACVLYPTVLREILLSVADAGLFQPVWSPRILDEWRHVAARQGVDQAAVAGAEIALLRLRFPDAQEPRSDARAAGIDWPDPTDRHVAETALASGAPTVVTANLRDFPRRAMAALGLAAVHPDAFLCALHHTEPDIVSAAVGAAHLKAQALGGPTDRSALLKRARLPRLAKLTDRP